MCDDAGLGEESIGMFSRGKAPMAGGQGKGKFSFIGTEVTLTGDIDTPGQLHVDGTVTGDVRCGSLSQGESGAVHGNIVAGEARLAGLVDGTVEAGTLTLEPTARVTGDVLYETLSIATGAQIEGRFKRRRGAADGSAPARIEARTKAQPPPVAPKAPELFAGEASDAAAVAAE
jgi:cytoskeletal protein CcmA (bactofilin family)